MQSSALDDVYNYNEIQEWLMAPVTISNTQGGNINKISLQQISGSTIPEFIIIGARPIYNSGLAAAAVPRYWLPVADAGFNLKFNNTTFNNGMRQRDIYEQSLRNGLSQVPYEQFIGKNLNLPNAVPSNDFNDALLLGGSFCVIDPARDCGIIAKGLTKGTDAGWTLSGSMNFVNQYYGMANAPTNQVQMFVIVMYAGVLTSTGKVYGQTSLVTKQETLNSLLSNQVPINANSVAVMGTGETTYSGSALLGGGKFTDVLKKIYDVAKPAVEYGIKHKDEIKSGFEAAKKHFGKGKGAALLGGGSHGSHMDYTYNGGAALDTSETAVLNKKKAVNRYLNSR